LPNSVTSRFKERASKETYLPPAIGVRIVDKSSLPMCTPRHIVVLDVPARRTRFNRLCNHIVWLVSEQLDSCGSRPDLVRPAEAVLYRFVQKKRRAIDLQTRD
jgi:hypothetical protein